jgi:hypothetical protein
MMLGVGLHIGWFGFGLRRDLFTTWIDFAFVSIGITPLVARARVEEVAVRFRKIKEALPDLKKGMRR